MRFDALSGTAAPGVCRAHAWPDGFGRTRAERSALLVLASLAGILPRDLVRVARREGSAVACLDAVRSGDLGSETDRLVAAEIDRRDVEAALGRCGARLVAPADAEYPPGLEHLTDPPAALFVRGRSVAEVPRRVAMVGARNCTGLGGEVAHEIGHGLGGAGLTVVSGGARGIDAASHRGALDGGGTTIAVLGCGIDVVYPRTHARLLERIVRHGAVISEYPPGVPPRAFRFPARNRIIAAMSEAVAWRSR